MALTCTNCQTQLPDDAKFCLACGTEVKVQIPGQQYLYCSYCGYEHPKDAKFCLYCGRPILEEPAERKRDESIRDELFRSSPYHADPLVELDFEKNKSKASIRAERWAEYEANVLSVRDWVDLLRIRGLLRYANDNWMLESSWFPTNKPNTHEALFIKTSMVHTGSQAARIY